VQENAPPIMPCHSSVRGVRLIIDTRAWCWRACGPAASVITGRAAQLAEGWRVAAFR